MTSDGRVSSATEGGDALHFTGQDTAECNTASGRVPSSNEEAAMSGDCHCSHGFSCPMCGGCRDHHEAGCASPCRPLDATDPYDEDGYCDWCGNGSWKNHAPDCEWADHHEAKP